MENRLRDLIRRTRRAVVKIGTSVLIQRDGRLSHKALVGIAREIAVFQKKGIQTVLVSSGAIAAGMHHLGFARRPHRLPELQACAAIGQPILIQLYQKALASARLPVAQVLITRNDLEDKTRSLNARHTLNELLSRGVIPIINENDTVVVEEIRVGDNDNLAALISRLVKADLLVLLTDCDGFYSADPRRDPKARRISFLEDLEEGLRSAAGTDKVSSTGGMKTKIQAAARTGGIPTIIADGRDRKVLEKILTGEPIGTIVMAAARKR